MEDLMSRLPLTALIAAAISVAACAHEQPAPTISVVQERDWVRGLDDRKPSQIAPVGPTKLRDAYALLVADKGPEAGRMAAEAVRVLRDGCSQIKAPLRTPVDPASRGFLIVWVLHANKAPPPTFLAGEPAPNTAEAV